MTIEERVKQVFNNHKQSSIQGMVQLLCCPESEVKSAVEKLVEDGYLTTEIVEWNGAHHLTYKRPNKKKATAIT